MTVVEPLFVDTNVLVYANVIESPLHAQALNTIKTAHDAERPMWISRQVLREYLVTMTRPQMFTAVLKATVIAQVNQFVDYFGVADDTPAATTNSIPVGRTSKN